MANHGSCALKHSSIESLNEASELPKEMIARLKTYSSGKMFSSIEKMILEARNARGDIEKQYTLYYRCAQLSKLIYKQNDFADFKAEHGAIFGLRFKEALDEADNLKTVLNKKYEEQMLRASQDASAEVRVLRNMENAATVERDARPSSSILISPKELVRMVEQAQPKKTVVIVDFRQDKSELISYKNDHVITVVTVPHEKIVTGLIFASLRNQLEVGQRPLLHRIGSCDLVVLMSDTGVELVNGQPLRGSKAHLLYMALYEYNYDYHPKSPPLFMDGGFDNWRDQYPVYTRIGGHLKRTEPKDQLDHMIINYKKACLMLDYPDLSPPRPPPIQKPPIVPTINGIIPTDIQYQSLKHVPNATMIRSADVDAQNAKRMETTFSAHDSAVSTSSIKSPSSAPQGSIAPTSVTISPKAAGDGEVSAAATSQPRSNDQKSGGPIAPTLAAPSRQSPVETSKHDPGVSQPVASGYHPSVEVGPLPAAPPRMPMVDRSNKPNQQFDAAQEGRLEAIHISPVSKTNAHPSQPRLPLPDRSTKPVLISIDQEQQLLDIYNSMCDSTEGSSNRRGSPRPGYTGLYNMGNTCFMNATLQALFHTPLLLSIFSKENFMSRVNPHNKMGTGGVISAVFSAMMDVIWSGQYTAIKPQRFLRLFASQVNSCLADGHQHDASEFQLFLLDALHEDTNQVTKRVSFEQNYKGGSQIMNDAKDYERKSRLFSCSPVNKIFNLQTVSELSCTACGEQSATFEECSLITVELPVHASRTSLHQCLSSHFSQTTLDGDCRWNCPRCRAPKRASRLTKLWSLPPVVVVHLKRFSMENGDYAKNTMPVDFDPGRLDLSEYLHENSPESAEPYRLYAVTNHCGRLNSGHYTALVCHGTTGEWLRFDDECVSSSSANGINTSEAYMLYYKRS
ncbi:Ubiquitin carboxyl-terminal hydrolase [Trichostrongylus colubriformis]|uniref:Ubiquitin carboxyl-terminal hydrolase n=1 Tax=Trichostrongylus colubriformis TaxID=6319 RepID=A0AAN8IJW9_TRICO